MRKIYNLSTLFLLIGCCYNVSSGQIGGSSVFPFLNTVSSARATGLGGALIASPEGNIALAVENPAQIRMDMDGQISFQHQFLPTGIQSGYVGFGKALPSKNLMTHVGVKYNLYGTADETDEFGNILGTFKGSEMALHLGASYQLYDKVTLGANVKYIQSTLDVYRSSGLAFDLGALYVDTAMNLAAAFVVKQSGWQLSAYDEIKEDLPLDIQIGISKRLKHLPFRFFITFHHLNKWNLLYNDPDNEEGTLIDPFLTLDKTPAKSDNFFRHMIFGGELLLGKQEAFRIRLGYNHQLKQELTVLNLRSLTGISFGLSLQVKKFQFDYGTTKVHLGGSNHHLGLTTNLKYFTGSGIIN